MSYVLMISYGSSPIQSIRTAQCTKFIYIVLSCKMCFVFIFAPSFVSNLYESSAFNMVYGRKISRVRGKITKFSTGWNEWPFLKQTRCLNRTTHQKQQIVFRNTPHIYQQPTIIININTPCIQPGRQHEQQNGNDLNECLGRAINFISFLHRKTYTHKKSSSLIYLAHVRVIITGVHFSETKRQL